MKRFWPIPPSRFSQDERGTTLVEFTIAVSLFLLIFFAVLDFGRLTYNWVMAEKAMQRAARIASVRLSVCSGVPAFNTRADANVAAVQSGTLCRDADGVTGEICRAVPTRVCTLNTANPGNINAQNTADEIWAAIRPMLPDNANRANVMISYEFDPQLGFLGGPYTPLITAELVGADIGDGNFDDFRFTFLTPLSALAAAAGASNTTDIPGEGASIPFPDISVTLPAEDLNIGGRG